MLMLELTRFAHAQKIRIERRLDSIAPPVLENAPRFRMFTTDDSDSLLINDAQNRILIFLGSINIGVLITAGGLGYFLAGRTLKPIADMVEEQRRFISDASHELRTPITSLKSSFEVYLRDPDLTLMQAKNLIKESVADVDRLQSLSDGLLTLAQYQQQAAAVPRERTDVQDCIRLAIRKVSVLANTKRITISDASKRAALLANKERITELFVILLDNAIKYSPEKSRITVKTTQRDGYVTISVTDQGMGITKKDLPHIFHRFYRTDTARERKGAGGYGLGLAIAKQIVTSHGGQITATSSLNKGSTFSVRLLIQKQEA